jgi:hypothetical protein
MLWVLWVLGGLKLGAGRVVGVLKRTGRYVLGLWESGRWWMVDGGRDWKGLGETGRDWE